MLDRQLTLQVQLRDEATFDNFFAASNAELLAHLQSGLHTFFYLWGNAGVGKSHLLQAFCLQAIDNEQRVIYLSLSESNLQPAVLEGLESYALVCLDDLQIVAGDKAWEEALFHFYNRVREANTRLIVAATVSPTQLPCQLADLQSRLAWGMVYRVHELSDVEKLQALQLRAKQRGLRLSDEVALFLLNRCARDMASLYDILEQLDHASLSAQRSLTIPFVKAVLKV